MLLDGNAYRVRLHRKQISQPTSQFVRVHAAGAEWKSIWVTFDKRHRPTPETSLADVFGFYDSHGVMPRIGANAAKKMRNVRTFAFEHLSEVAGIEQQRPSDAQRGVVITGGVKKLRQLTFGGRPRFSKKIVAEIG